MYNLGKLYLWLELHTYLYAELGTRSFVPGSLSAQFLSMDRYCSIARFADFQVAHRSIALKKTQWFALGKER